MSLKQKAIKGSIFNTVRSGLEALLGVATFLVFARLLQPRAFGIYALASAVVALSETVIDLGFKRALIQRKEISDTHRNTAFWTVLAVSCCVYLVISGSTSVFVLVFQEPALSGILPVLALALIMQGYSDIAKGQLMRNLQFDFIAYCSVAASVVGTITGITLAYYDWGVWSLVYYRLSMTFVSSLGFWFGFSWVPSFGFSLSHFYSLLAFGKNIAGRNLMRRIGSRLDDLIIGYFLGSTTLGFYTIAYRIMSLTGQLLVGSLSNVAMPLFSRLQSEVGRLKQALMSALKLTAAVALPVYASIIVMGDQVVRLLFGDKWESSVPVLRILLLSGLAVIVLKFMIALLESLDRAHYDMYLTLTETTLIAGVFPLLAPLGLAAVSTAYVGIKFLLLPITLYFSLSLVNTSVLELIQAISHPLLGSLTAASGLYLFDLYFVTVRPFSYGSLLLRGTSFLVLYLGYLVVFAPELLLEIRDMVLGFFTGQRSNVFMD